MYSAGKSRHSLDVQFILRPSGRGFCHQEDLYLYLHLYISILCEVEGSLRRSWRNRIRVESLECVITSSSIETETESMIGLRLLIVDALHAASGYGTLVKEFVVSHRLKIVATNLTFKRAQI